MSAGLGTAGLELISARFLDPGLVRPQGGERLGLGPQSPCHQHSAYANTSLWPHAVLSGETFDKKSISSKSDYGIK